MGPQIQQQLIKKRHSSKAESSLYVSLLVVFHNSASQLVFVCQGNLKWVFSTEIHRGCF